MIRAQNYLIVHQKQFLICLFFKSNLHDNFILYKDCIFKPFDYSSFYKKYVKFEVEYEFEICGENVCMDILILFSSAMYSFHFV